MRPSPPRRRPVRLGTILLVALFAAACSHGYVASGQFAGSAIPLNGKAYLHGSGGGRFTISTPDRTLMCDGTALPPVVPASGPGCLGESGNGVVHCTNGEKFDISWKATNCRAFSGSGINDKGVVFRFSIDKTGN